jgi:hypothetical protein
MSYIDNNEWPALTRSEPECRVFNLSAVHEKEEEDPLQRYDYGKGMREREWSQFFDSATDIAVKVRRTVQQNKDSLALFQDERTGVVAKNGVPRRVLRKKEVVRWLNLEQERGAELTPSPKPSKSSPDSRSSGGNGWTNEMLERSIMAKRRMGVGLHRNTRMRRGIKRVEDKVKQKASIEEEREGSDVGLLKQLQYWDELILPLRVDSKLAVISTSPWTGTGLTRPSGPSPIWPLRTEPLQNCNPSTQKQKAVKTSVIVSTMNMELPEAQKTIRKVSAIRIGPPKRSVSGKGRKPMFTENFDGADESPRKDLKASAEWATWKLPSSTQPLEEQDFEPLVGRQILAVEGHQPQTWRWRTGDQTGGTAVLALQNIGRAH